MPSALSPPAMLLILALPVQAQAGSVGRFHRTALVPEGFPNMQPFGYESPGGRAGEPSGTLQEDGALFNEIGPFVEFVGLIVGDPKQTPFDPLLPLAAPLQ